MTRTRIWTINTFVLRTFTEECGEAAIKHAMIRLPILFLHDLVYQQSTSILLLDYRRCIVTTVCHSTGQTACCCRQCECVTRTVQGWFDCHKRHGSNTGTRHWQCSEVQPMIANDVIVLPLPPCSITTPPASAAAAKAATIGRRHRGWLPLYILKDRRLSEGNL